MNTPAGSRSIVRLPSRLPHVLLVAAVAAAALLGCETLNRYKAVDAAKDGVRSLAVLPLVAGDENGRLRSGDNTEVREFIAYFNSRFWTDFAQTVKLLDPIVVKPPGRDFTINAWNGMD